MRAMREHLGDGFPLMVDANMKWSVDQAIRAARALPALRPHLAGGADHPRRPAGHARIVAKAACRSRRAKICASLWEFKHYIASGGVTYPEPDVTNCGGVTPFMKIAHLAEAFNLPVTSHGAHDVTVHLLAACPNRVLPRGARLRPRALHRAARCNIEDGLRLRRTVRGTASPSTGRVCMTIRA